MEHDVVVAAARAWFSAGLYVMFAVYVTVRLALFLLEAVHDAWPPWLNLNWSHRKERRT